MAHPLALTGERTLPGVAGEQYWFARHEAAYAWVARRFVAPRPTPTVVDAGCGEGYGAAMLRAAGADHVVGLDLDASAARHLARSYPAVAPVRANLVALPVRSAVADLVVGLQVVEHLWDVPSFLEECRRVLRPGGRLVVTTPNREVFSPGLGRGERPTNPFHVEEFDAAQLVGLAQGHGFVTVRVAGLHHGPRLARWEHDRGTSLVAAQVALVTGTAPAPEDTASFVVTCTAADFLAGGPDGAQDLLLSAVRPATEGPLR